MTTTLRKLILSGDAVSLVAGRVYPLRLPDEYELPAIAIQLITKERDYNFSTATEGAHRSLTFQVNCCDATYEGARLLSEAVIAKISNYQGTFNGTNIRNIEITSETDLDGIEPDSQEQTLYVRALDVLFQYEV